LIRGLPATRPGSSREPNGQRTGTATFAFYFAAIKQVVSENKVDRKQMISDWQLKQLIQMTFFAEAASADFLLSSILGFYDLVCEDVATKSVRAND